MNNNADPSQPRRRRSARAIQFIHLSIPAFAVLHAHPQMAKFEHRRSLENWKAQKRENLMVFSEPAKDRSSRNSALEDD